MSKRQLTDLEKAKADAARKGIASLRRAAPTETAEGRNARARRAVIAYMRQRGLLVDWPQETDRIKITVDCCTLPWNPTAPPRAYQLRLIQKRASTMQYRRRASQGPEMEEIARVTVPHWDYDGVNPLIAREPWEREEANQRFDVLARYRHYNWRNGEMEHEASEMEACERLNEEQPGQFTFAGSRDWA